MTVVMFLESIELENQARRPRRLGEAHRTHGGSMNQPALSLVPQPGSTLSPDDEARLALDAFDKLRPGERVSLTLVRSPRSLLARFRLQRKGQFNWTPTSDGPSPWQVEVSCREAEKGSLRTVNETLSWDHDRLDDLEARAFAARDRGDLAQAAALMSAFAFGLRRHIRFEEELLFPEFESRLSLSPEMGPTAVMRDEHREILGFLDRLERAMGDGASNVDSLRHGLHSVLGNHNLKEENIVYPGTDQAMSPLERDTLVERIQAL